MTAFAAARRMHGGPAKPIDRGAPITRAARPAVRGASQRPREAAGSLPDRAPQLGSRFADHSMTLRYIASGRPFPSSLLLAAHHPTARALFGHAIRLSPRLRRSR